MTNNKKTIEDVRFGMPTKILDDLLTSVGKQNGSLRSTENVSVSKVDVEGPVTVVSGDIYERTVN